MRAWCSLVSFAVVVSALRTVPGTQEVPSNIGEVNDGGGESLPPKSIALL